MIKIVNDTKAYAHLEYQALSHELKVMRRQQRKLGKVYSKIAKALNADNESETNKARLEGVAVSLGWWQKRASATKLYARSYNLIVGYLKGRSYDQIENIRYSDVPPAILGRCITDTLENDEMTAFYKWYAQRPAINGSNIGTV